MRPRIARCFVLGVVLATTLTVPLGSPAAAAPTNNCTIDSFPNTPGGLSNLQTNCTNTTATVSASTVIRHEDFQDAVWHQGASRFTGANGNTTNGSATITNSTARFTFADVNHPISGANIPPDAFIRSVTNATTAVMNIPATVTQTGQIWRIENGDGRLVTNGTTTIGSTTISSPSMNFRAADIGRVVEGTNIRQGAKITSVPNANTAVLSLAATATGLGDQQLTVSPAPTFTTSRQIKDGVSTNGSKQITSATARFQAGDVNLTINGPGVGAGNFIASVVNPTTAMLKNNATASGSGQVWTIGLPSATAPLNDEVVANLGAELNLNPGLVAGEDECSTGTTEGFALQGIWRNPGFFDPAPLGSSTDAVINSPVIAQVIFPTTVISFAAYVMQVPPNKPGETHTVAHYDVVFPLLPTGLAVCPSPDSVGAATTFNYAGFTLSQQTLDGVGVPGTASVRMLKDVPAPPPASKFNSSHLKLLNSGGVVQFQVTKTCNLQYPGNADFLCGNA
jgi:hypothetical protein